MRTTVTLWLAGAASAALLAAACASGCGGAMASSGAPGEASARRPNVERRVAPFTVVDEEGRPYEHPFLGGLNVPRPQFVDIDGDGDLDLFVQERTHEVMHFENVGTAEAGEFVWRSDRFGDLRVGDWYRFVDLDGDGDQDLFAEERYSYIRYYRNEGTPAAPRFTLVADSVEDSSGEPIFSDRQNIPFLVDLDCDGLMDLFLGRIDGTVSRLEEVRGAGAGRGDAGGGGGEAVAPRFDLVADRFEGIQIIGQIGGTMHGANSMVFADPDQDGDYDLLWGDFFEPSVLLIENVGSCERPNLAVEPVPFPTVDSLSTSGYNAAAMADVDGDGDLELFVGVLGGAFNPNKTQIENFHFWERLPDGYYDRVTTRFLRGIDIGSETIPAFADLDGDGDQDLLLGNKLDVARPERARLYWFENVGTPTEPSFALADTLDLREAYHYAPETGDLDGDGVAEVLLGSWRADLALYRVERGSGGPTLTLVDSAFVVLPRAGNAVPALGDIDGDGDLDLLVGEAAGNINFFRNQGSPTRADFVLESETFLDIDPGRRSAPALGDIDGDGDLDLTVGSEEGGLILYRNEGTPSEPRFVLDEGFSAPLHGYSVPRWVDIDGDGDLDLFAGDLGGGVTFWESLSGGTRRP